MKVVEVNPMICNQISQTNKAHLWTDMLNLESQYKHNKRHFSLRIRKLQAEWQRFTHNYLAPDDILYIKASPKGKLKYSLCAGGQINICRFPHSYTQTYFLNENCWHISSHAESAVHRGSYILLISYTGITFWKWYTVIDLRPTNEIEVWV